MELFKLPAGLLKKRVAIHLVGVGGNGGHMLTGLAKLHQAMLALGHEHGLHVSAFDDDRVSESNVGRQLYYPSDVGQYKVDVLVNRVNLSYGLDFKASTQRYRAGDIGACDFVVGCVDTAASRRQIANMFNWAFWMDLGNGNSAGQVVLGQRPQQDRGLRLPTVVDLYPELLDDSIPEDDAPSCSLADALLKQELFVNQGVSTFALNMLWTLFTSGELDYSAVFVNLKSAVASPLPIDPKAWKKRFGYVSQASRKHRPAIPH